MAFYNIKANLMEWEENYDEAIVFIKSAYQFHFRCFFEYGATFVNMAISYRFKYILDEKKVKKINKSIKLGRLGKF